MLLHFRSSGSRRDGCSLCRRCRAVSLPTHVSSSSRLVKQNDSRSKQQHPGGHSRSHKSTCTHYELVVDVDHLKNSCSKQLPINQVASVIQVPLELYVSWDVGRTDEERENTEGVDQSKRRSQQATSVRVQDKRIIARLNWQTENRTEIHGCLMRKVCNARATTGARTAHSVGQTLVALLFQKLNVTPGVYTQRPATQDCHTVPSCAGVENLTVSDINSESSSLITVARAEVQGCCVEAVTLSMVVADSSTATLASTATL